MFVERERLCGDEIYAFLEREESRVPSSLLDDDATIEDYIGLIGHAVFAQPIEDLGLDTRAIS